MKIKWKTQTSDPIPLEKKMTFPLAFHQIDFVLGCTVQFQFEKKMKIAFRA